MRAAQKGMLQKAGEATNEVAAFPRLDDAPPQRQISELAPRPAYSAASDATKQWRPKAVDKEWLVGFIAATIKRGSPLVTEASARTIADTVVKEITAAEIINIADHLGRANAAEEKSSDRRREKRERTLKFGKIVYAGSSCIMDCTLLDITEGGARLKPADIMICPEEFVLKIQYGETKNCEVRWRKGTELGVRFR